MQKGGSHATAMTGTTGLGGRAKRTKLISPRQHLSSSPGLAVPVVQTAGAAVMANLPGGAFTWAQPTDTATAEKLGHLECGEQRRFGLGFEKGRPKRRCSPHSKAGRAGRRFDFLRNLPPLGCCVVNA